MSKYWITNIKQTNSLWFHLRLQYSITSQFPSHPLPGDWWDPESYQAAPAAAYFACLSHSRPSQQPLHSLWVPISRSCLSLSVCVCKILCVTYRDVILLSSDCLAVIIVLRTGPARPTISLSTPVLSALCLMLRSVCSLQSGFCNEMSLSLNAIKDGHRHCNSSESVMHQERERERERDQARREKKTGWHWPILHCRDTGWAMAGIPPDVLREARDWQPWSLFCPYYGAQLTINYNLQKLAGLQFTNSTVSQSWESCLLVLLREHKCKDVFSSSEAWPGRQSAAPVWGSEAITAITTRRIEARTRSDWALAQPDKQHSIMHHLHHLHHLHVLNFFNSDANIAQSLCV